MGDPVSAEGVRTVAVVGAGTMGPGMAAMFASHGFDTRLTDVKPDVLARARGTVDTVLKTLVGGGFLSQSDADSGISRLTYVSDLQEAVSGAEFVVEAIPERLDVKQGFFAEIEPLVSDDTIL